MERRMKNKLILSSLMFLSLPATSFANTENTLKFDDHFKATIITEGLSSPWEMLWGPDNMLWVTEREASRVVRINPETGEKKVAIVIEGVFIDHQQNGLLGMAFAPNMTAQKGEVYLTYTYKGKNQAGKQGHWAKIIKMDYNAKTEKLNNPKIIMDGIPASNDHNSGRLTFGPDQKLYFSKGELGHNQGAYQCLLNQAQRTPTEKEVKNSDWTAYVGKILRLNADGSIPADNPQIHGVKSHLFTYGHRNPQGLVFVGKELFSVEHGPSSDDEINRLVAGGNYGWPNVAGYLDDNAYQYENWSAAPDCDKLVGTTDTNRVKTPPQVPVLKESQWKKEANFQEPIKTFYTVPKNYNFNDARCKDIPYLCWPTIGPSSIAYYPNHGPIKNWRNSLLVTSLKNGALYTATLDANKVQVQGDIAKYFHSQNRYRAITIHPDLKSIYLATDATGNVLDRNGQPANKVTNPGAIIKITYQP